MLQLVQVIFDNHQELVMSDGQSWSISFPKFRKYESKFGIFEPFRVMCDLRTKAALDPSPTMVLPYQALENMGTFGIISCLCLHSFSIASFFFIINYNN